METSCFFVSVHPNNFPPLPPCCPIKPCCYVNLLEQIPPSELWKMRVLTALLICESGKCSNFMSFTFLLPIPPLPPPSLPFLLHPSPSSSIPPLPPPHPSLPPPHPSPSSSIPDYWVVLVYNFICTIAGLVEATDTATFGTTFGVAIAYTILFVPCSLFCWWYPAYYGYK